MAKSAKTKKSAKAKKARKSIETIDCAARDALCLVGKALAALHGLESQAQQQVNAAVDSCRKLEG
jgi:hypothetical protein